MKTGNIFMFLLVIFSSAIFCAEADRVEKEKLYSNGKTEEKWQEKKVGDNFVKDGYFKRWHKNGKLGCVGQYKNGKKDGKWIFYYENGEINDEQFFKDGKEDGEWHFWRNGKIEIISYYKEGVLIKRLQCVDGKVVPME